jgi:hypothetical protein
MRERTIRELLIDVDRAVHIRQTRCPQSPEWRKASAQLPLLFEDIRLRTSAAVGIAAAQALVDAAESHPEVAAEIGERLKLRLRNWGFEIIDWNSLSNG